MAISYVGGVQGGRAGATTTTTQSLSGTLTGGSNTSPSAGDLVVVLCASGADTTAAPSQNISGNNNGAYTGLTAQSSVVATTYDSYQRVSYIIQGSTVDTSITIPSSGSARNAQRWVVHVFRGVDPTTPMDATATYATGTATGRPNPAAITPVTAGAWIAAFYASAAATGAAYTAPTDFATDWLGGTTADTADCMAGGGYYTGWTSGSYDPAAITAGGTTNAADSWTATTIALRPSTPPTVSLSSPADTASTTDTTPDLVFTGTDAESNDIRYNVQVDTVNTFDSQGSGQLFSEDFEGGSLPAGFDSQASSSTSSTVIDGTSKVTGTYSAKLGATGSGSGQYLIKNLGSDYTEIYIQFNIFIPTAFAYGTATSFVLMELRDGSANSVIELKIDDYGTQEIILGGGTLGYTDTTIALSKNTIHKVELYFKSNASTGAWKLWVDNNTEGSPDASGSSLNTGSYPTRIVNFGSYYADGSITDNIYVDDFKVNNTFIGSSGAGGPLIDVVSGTDSGFSGSPDNTDPFTSGQAVTYTVQSALTAPDTYYWRVSGIDPSGSNTYGAWSSTRSFDVTTGSNYSGTPGIATLTLTAQTPTVALSDNKSVTLASPTAIVISPQTPTVKLDNRVTPGIIALTTANQTPTASLSDNKFATPGIATLSLTAQTPTVSATANVAVTPGVASLTTTNFTPTVAVTDNKQITLASPTSLTLSPQTPTVTATNNIAVTPGTESLATSTFSIGVAVSSSSSITPGTASLTLTPQTPTVSFTANSWATPNTASLTLSPQTPIVDATDNKTATPGTASLSLTPHTPTVVVDSGPIEITPGVASMITAMFAPTATVTANQTITPSTARLRLRTSYPIVNGQVREKSYYIDSAGNIYWVIDQSLGLVEKV